MIYTCKACGADMVKHARFCPDCLKAEKIKATRKTQAPKLENLPDPYYLASWNNSEFSI